MRLLRKSGEEAGLLGQGILIGKRKAQISCPDGVYALRGRLRAAERGRKMEKDGMSVSTVRLTDTNIVRIEKWDCVESTQALARKYARDGYADRYIVYSERQTESPITGTRLRPGESEYGVFISCILRPSIFPAQAGFLGAMSAVALVTALEHHTDRRLGIGWVSDLYCEGRKIGGAVTEGKLDSFSAYEYVIVSFAVRLGKSDFPPRLSDMVNMVFSPEPTTIPMIIAKDILNKFFSFYINLRTPSKFMDIYRQRFVQRDAPVLLLSDGRHRRGRVADVDTESGALTVRLPHGRVEQIFNQKSVILPRRVRIRKSKR